MQTTIMVVDGEEDDIIHPKHTCSNVQFNPTASLVRSPTSQTAYGTRYLPARADRDRKSR